MQVLSEPRLKEEGGGEKVRLFYQQVCSSIRRVDSKTPCMVGASPFYNRERLEEACTRTTHRVRALSATLCSLGRARSRVLATVLACIHSAYVQQVLLDLDNVIYNFK